MNDMTGTERAELAGMLPPPDVPELSADRHRELKGAYLLMITEAPKPKAARSRWMMFAVPATAVAVAAVAAVGVTLDRSPDDEGPGGLTASIVAIDPGSAAEVGPLFNRLALAAAGRPDTPVGDGQFVYVRSKVAWLVFAGDRDDDGVQSAGHDPMVLDKVHSREIWVPASVGDKGQIRERGEKFGLSGARPNRLYAGLPTEPGALLRKIYELSHVDGNDPHDMAFDYIGEALRETILPPKLAAALYRAAAQIPGVVLVADSVDAAGRHGVAVARTDALGERTEWIFDRGTFEYLGERSYLVRDTDIGKAGMLTATTAVLERAVVGKKGQLPK